ATHNFGGLQAEMKDILRSGVIKAAAHLSSYVEQIPDGKSFLAGQHGGDAVALDIFHRRTKLSVDLPGAVNGREVRVAQTLDGLVFFEQAFFQIRRTFAKGRQLDRFQGNRLARLRVVRLV